MIDTYARTLLAWYGSVQPYFMCMGYAGYWYSSWLITNASTVEEHLTSEERHVARYHRRQEKRLKNKQERCAAIGGLHGAFTCHDMYKWGKKCCNGVRWKYSTQNFERHIFSTTATSRRRVLDGTWHPAQGEHFVICERGKTREIDAPTIADRQVEKTLTKNILLPLYKPCMIYNNGASLKGKGFYFAQEQLKADLRRHYRKYGKDGYVLLIDIKKFFPSASHDVIRGVHDRLIFDDELKDMCGRMLEYADGNRGQPLGVESSQAEMVHYLSPLDHYVTCQMGYAGYGHYMDDIYVLLQPGCDCAKVRDEIATFCHNRLGLEVNINKTYCKPLNRPFRYCKIKYWLTDNGRIKTVGAHRSLPRARHKMRAFYKFHKHGKLPLENIRMSLWAIMSYLDHYDDNNRRGELIGVFTNFFHIKWNDLTSFRT